jgi:hypothetical protein
MRIGGGDGGRRRLLRGSRCDVEFEMNLGCVGLQREQETKLQQCDWSQIFLVLIAVGGELWLMR